MQLYLNWVIVFEVHVSPSVLSASQKPRSNVVHYVCLNMG